jgi:hypothetical protein
VGEDICDGTGKWLIDETVSILTLSQKKYNDQRVAAGIDTHVIVTGFIEEAQALLDQDLPQRRSWLTWGKGLLVNIERAEEERKRAGREEEEFAVAQAVSPDVIDLAPVENDAMETSSDDRESESIKTTASRTNIKTPAWKGKHPDGVVMIVNSEQVSPSCFHLFYTDY